MAIARWHRHLYPSREIFMGQVIGIDSSVFIYLLEEHPQFLSRARKALLSVQEGKYEAVLSVIGMIEILTGPKLQGKKELAAHYKELIKNFPHVRIMGIDESVVDIASDLRGKYRLRTPDAIHIATAIAHSAEKFVTNDMALKVVTEIPIEMLA